MRRLLCALPALLLATSAGADELDDALLALATAAPGEARLEAAQRVIGLGAPATDALRARLERPRASSDADRRAVLARFGAEIPDVDGRWVAPPRPRKGEPAPKEPDWLAELARMPGAEPALLESLETVVLIRALAETREPRAADAILTFAFSPEGITFRDECGRNLRKMSPYSLPTLLRASQEKKRSGGAYARYANYQLDRQGKGLPAYALQAAPDDALEVAMLRAIRDVKHPDAVNPVLQRCDARSNAVRRAAREAWMAYVTGPPPPPAPKAKRKLPGGKKTKEELPLYLTYRELAEQELRTALTELGHPPGRRMDLAEASKQLFALYDQRRAAQWDGTMAEATALARAGKWAEAAAKYDSILVHDPLYLRRAEMVPVYLELGRQLGRDGKWEEAALAYDKAYSLDATGPRARQAEADLHYARAQVLRARGEDPEGELAQALAADPEHEAAKSSARDAKAAAARARRGWMLYAGLGGGALALALVALALRARRQRG